MRQRNKTKYEFISAKQGQGSFHPSKIGHQLVETNVGDGARQARDRSQLMRQCLGVTVKHSIGG